MLAGVLSAVCALVWSNIADILEFVYDFWAPSMVLPFLVGAFGYRPSRSRPVVWSMIGGTVGTILWRFVLESPGDVSPALFGFGVAVAVYLLACPLYKEPSSGRWLRPGPTGTAPEARSSQVALIEGSPADAEEERE